MSQELQIKVAALEQRIAAIEVWIATAQNPPPLFSIKSVGNRYVVVSAEGVRLSDKPLDKDDAEKICAEANALLEGANAKRTAVSTSV